MERNPALPVDAILPEVCASLKRHPNLVIEAPPGAGKTTRVPPALLGLGEGDVVVLEPRRIAARLAARRVASEMAEQIGETVGYQVRFEEAIGTRTRLRFVTEGILTRRLLSDPDLNGVSAVVLDEFHERHLDSDLALALLKRLQRTRPGLRIVVMSATLDSNPIAHYLGGCPVLRSEGSRFELAIEYLGYSPAPLEEQVRGAVERLLRERHSADILVFLPGALEIRRAMRQCEVLARASGLLVLPLHGSLLPKEQDLALAPAGQQKVILSTNVAESSVTVDGVGAVIDSGLARFAAHSPWSGLPTLNVARVSKASVKQRAGRAARTGPGRVLRLFTEADYQHRVEQDPPQILRDDLSQLCLHLRAMRISGRGDLEWLDAPPAEAMERAELLLDRLGATGDMSKQLARYPLPPRLARIVVEALQRGVGESGCSAAALIESGTQASKNDLLAAMESHPDARTLQHFEQIRRIAKSPGKTRHDDKALLMSILTGYPDRVARKRAGTQVQLSTGGSAEVQGEAPRYEYMVAIDAEDRKDKPLPLIRMTAKIEPEWLIDLFPESVHEGVSVEWNREAERVDGVSTLMYDELVIERSQNAAPDAEAAAKLLSKKALEAGIEHFVDPGALAYFLGRVEFAGMQAPAIEDSLREMCKGLRSFKELKAEAASFMHVLEGKLSARRLNEIAPATILLPGGRRTKVHYERGKQPWIGSRLQDFFGMRETPRLGADRKPVVVHLLAPNHRPVQTTTDLAGFWERLYPQVRRELMRRYPKHKWPETP